jgi:hypothetical protein
LFGVLRRSQFRRIASLASIVFGDDQSPFSPGTVIVTVRTAAKRRMKLYGRSYPSEKRPA